MKRCREVVSLSGICYYFCCWPKRNGQMSTVFDDVLAPCSPVGGPRVIGNGQLGGEPAVEPFHLECRLVTFSVRPVSGPIVICQH